MSNFTVETGSNHNVLNWEKKLNLEALKMMTFSKYFGSSENAGIKITSDSTRGKEIADGDTVYTTLLVNLTGEGVSGDADMQGNEENMVLHRQTVIIDQLRNAVKSAGKITEQRTFINFREQARGVLQKWGADIIDKWAANQLSGNTAISSNNLAGMQTPTAPSSATGNLRIIYGPLADTTEASLSASAGQSFRLKMIDDAIAHAEVSTPVLEPMDTPAGPKWILILHPFQIHSLKTHVSASDVTWYDYNKALIQGGKNVRDNIGNPLRGALGEYNNTLIFSNSRMPLAPSTTRVRRAVFFGAQAASLAFGAGSAGAANLRFRHIIQEEDYKNRIGVGVQLIGGLKKNVYNSIDLNVMVLSSHAAAP